MESNNDEMFMRAALDEARQAFQEDEIPVGVVIVANGRIVARAHNLTQHLNDTTAHAEMLALTMASAQAGKYLPDVTLYVTLEPCIMCAGALSWAQVGRIVYGAKDSKRGYSNIQRYVPTSEQGILHPKTQVTSGVLETECAALLKEFFAKKR